MKKKKKLLNILHHQKILQLFFENVSDKCWIIWKRLYSHNQTNKQQQQQQQQNNFMTKKWVVYKKIGDKNVSDSVIKDIKGIFNTKKPTKKQKRIYKKIGKEVISGLVGIYI